MATTTSEPITRLELIARLGREWKVLRQKYPDESNPDGYRKLAVMLAITALAEEEYGVKDWHELLPKKRKRREIANA